MGVQPQVRGNRRFSLRRHFSISHSSPVYSGVLIVPLWCGHSLCLTERIRATAVKSTNHGVT